MFFQKFDVAFYFEILQNQHCVIIDLIGLSAKVNPRSVILRETVDHIFDSVFSLEFLQKRHYVAIECYLRYRRNLHVE